MLAPMNLPLEQIRMVLPIRSDAIMIGEITRKHLLWQLVLCILLRAVLMTNE